MMGDRPKAEKNFKVKLVTLQTKMTMLTLERKFA